MNESGQPQNVIVELVVPRSATDAAVGQLWMMGTTGIEERDLVDQPDQLMLRAGFDNATAADDALAAMAQPAGAVPFQEVGRLTPDGSELEPANRFAATVTVGDRLVVAPSHRRANEEGHHASSTLVTIDAARSFGHGGHPTTQLALQALVELVGPATPRMPGTPDELTGEGPKPEPSDGGQKLPTITSMIDVGCGSGVVAISALKLGVARAVGIDTNIDAINASRANAIANRVEDRLGLVHNDLANLTIGQTGTFPLVVANLEAPILEVLASRLLDLTQPGGFLVLSGLLEERWTTLAPSFLRTRRVVQPVRTPVLDGWISPVLRLTEPPSG